MQHGGISSLIRQLLKRTQVMHLKILIGHQKIWSHLGISLGVITILKCQFPEVNYSKQLKMKMQPYNTLFIKTPQNWKVYTRIRKMERENSQDVKLAQTRCQKLSMSKKSYFFIQKLIVYNRSTMVMRSVFWKVGSQEVVRCTTTT